MNSPTKAIRALAAAIAFCAGLTGSAIAAASSEQIFHLQGIADGDTLYVYAPEERASYRVRMAAIDAPEKSQAYGTEAHQALQQLLRGTGRVSLRVHGKDRYGRLVSTVFDSRNRNINLMLVESGAAWVYHPYAKRPEHQDIYDQLIAAERNARAQQRGLWGHPAPIEPWKYRRGH